MRSGHAELSLTEFLTSFSHSEGHDGGNPEESEEPPLDEAYMEIAPDDYPEGGAITARFRYNRPSLVDLTRQFRGSWNEIERAKPEAGLRSWHRKTDMRFSTARR
jgi:hypothetical protein